jgi:hypothetical protein
MSDDELRVSTKISQLTDYMQKQLGRLDLGRASSLESNLSYDRAALIVEIRERFAQEMSGEVGKSRERILTAMNRLIDKAESLQIGMVYKTMMYPFVAQHSKPGSAVLRILEGVAKLTDTTAPTGMTPTGSSTSVISSDEAGDITM